MPSLNHGSTIIVCSDDASIDPDVDGAALFAWDTRFIRRWTLLVNGRPLTVLKYIEVGYARGRWEMLATPGVTHDPQSAPSDFALTLQRTVYGDRLHEDIALRTFSPSPVEAQVVLRLETDFADFFETRSGEWQTRDIETAFSDGTLARTYRNGGFFRGLITRIVGHPPSYEDDALTFTVRLERGQYWRICVDHRLLTTDTPSGDAACPLVASVDRVARRSTTWAATTARFDARDDRLNTMVARSLQDLEALRLPRSSRSRHSVPAAGVPWFMSVFGRDSIITSLESMLFQPDFALGTLERLAELQAMTDNPVTDAEPGKICHELRQGEWSELGRVPYHPYYGSADSTALYVLLLGEVFRWQGNAEKLRRFKGVAERCLTWIDQYGDLDGDGFQEYRPRSISGYPNQCWRDSPDGVPQLDGSRPHHPIGTCELQAYVYGAKRAVAGLFEAWGDGARAIALRGEAAQLRERFRSAFWMPNERFVALALDGNKHRVESITSNPGHCLWMGILDPDQGDAVAARLLKRDMYSGWGIRTLASTHHAYDPHSYHRGSVWPHDTMLAAAGLRRYGHIGAAWRLISSLLDAASLFPRFQIPEVFSGLGRDEVPVPLPYRQANVPQAWAAAAALQGVTIMLGLEPDLPNNRIHVDPALPHWCSAMEVTNVRLGDRVLDIAARRTSRGQSELDVVVRKGPALEVVRRAAAR